jgi:hypothetical protein
VIAEPEGRRLFALCEVDVKLNLATQGRASAHEFGLAPLGVADGLREREDNRLERSCGRTLGLDLVRTDPTYSLSHDASLKGRPTGFRVPMLNAD